MSIIPTISVKSSYYGLSASSSISLNGEGLTLKITTSKRSSGKIATMASVCVVSNENGFVCERHTIFQDYSKQVAASECKRITEKALVTQQETYLKEGLEATLQEVYLHYGIAPALVENAA